MRGSAKKVGESRLFDDQPAVVAAAAHELKSPLTVITYIAQMLGDQNLGLSDAERAQYLQRLQIVSQRTLRLVQQLTVSYRMGEGSQLGFQFNLEPVNASEVCEAALHELSPYAREYNQTLQFIAGTCPHLVVANREILYDIVVNLVDNAIRHNTPGSAVAVRPHCMQQRVRLDVHDNGQAVKTRELARLRQNLGREPQPFAGHAGTSGLGLYIASQMAGAMGGSLGLGRAAQGTTFFVDLLRSRQLGLW
jgi:signal transduction histidine kinase